MPSLAFVLLIVVIGLLVMIPTRRLFLAGWTPSALAAYFLAVLALALFVAELRGPARYLIPILVIAYIAPFITARDGIARLRNRMGGAPPMPKDGPGSKGATGASGTTGAADRGSGDGRSRRPPPKNVTPKEASPPDVRG